MRLHRALHMRRVLVGAALAACAVAPAWSQSNLRPTLPGVWKPWKPFSAVASARKEQGVTPAEVKAFEAELLALDAILKRASGVATPVGFSVETWGHLDGSRAPAHAPGHPGARALPMAGGFTFGAFPIFEYERNGKIVRSDTGETALQPFLVNRVGREVFDTRHVAEWGGIDHDAYLQPLPRGEIAGLPRYGDNLIVARDPEALWTPLALAAALDIVVMARRDVVSGFRGSLATLTEQLTVVRDPARRATRLKEARDASVNMPDPGAFVAQIEEALRIEETTLERELSPAGGTGKGLAEAERALADVTSWLAELAPSERAAPACYVEQGQTLRAKFRPAPTPGCVPLVRPNYTYFDTTLPRSTPQVVVITSIARCFDTADKSNRDANAPGPHGCAANRALVATMDTAAIRAWIR